MATSNPLRLSTSTRLPPSRLRPHSRSPSRSPIRKSQFLARELDPLLSNLSPDSTLKALQATSTISDSDAGQDALAKSIADVSPSEREIGIRAAVAAQKLKQWKKEVETWIWPDRRGRSRGAGFLQPKSEPINTSPRTSKSYLGSLPVQLVKGYQERIEDIRDGIEALELEDIKDHIFSAHVPREHLTEPSTPPRAQQLSYGRMRDFTALVTATVVQALPDMANLIMLLDTWDIRLAVLRQSTSIEHSIHSTRSGIKTAASIVHDPETGPLVTYEEYDMTKKLLGEKVATLGAKVDKLLDMLEGQEDTLPQTWIQSLEDIENDYAAWVVDAEHVAMQNDLRSKADMTASASNPNDIGELPVIQPISPLVDPSMSQILNVPTTTVVDTSAQDSGVSAAESAPDVPSVVFPFLKAPHEPPMSRSGHRRDVSEVSMAESAFSGMSDLSQAEIVDARSTQVLTSPNVRVVDNPRASRDGLALFNHPESGDMDGISRPPMLQRASTASIEVLSKDQLRRVTLQKTQSQDMLNTIAQSPPSTPSKALRQLTGADSVYNSPSRTVGNEDPFIATPDFAAPVETTQAIPRQSLPVVDPASQNPGLIHQEGALPEIPRRSSKRLSMADPAGAELLTSSQFTGHDDVFGAPKTMPNNHGPSTSPSKRAHIDPTTESLEDKIKDILTTMPTQIRLGSELDGDSPSEAPVAPSSRSSTPFPVLTLSPVKAERSNRRAAPGDVRLFHLTRTGQSRDAPPVKLFVRAVGESGERVMVRVGGGWADLAEYLREYSLHHGHRGLMDDKLEVANFPGSNTAKDVIGTPKADSSTLVERSDSTFESSDKGRSLPSGNSGFGGISNLSVGKLRKGSHTTSSDSGEIAQTRASAALPLPQRHDVQTPVAMSADPNSIVETAMVSNNTSSNPTQMRTISTPQQNRNTEDQFNSPMTYSSTPSPGNSNYTPLGAAGPRTNGRRVMSLNATRDANKEAWVEGVVDKARAVSGNTTSTTIHGPTITTTTRMVSKSTPTSRRVSTMPTSSPTSDATTLSPSSSISTNNSSSSKTKNRISSFGDVSGIKRVFLRRKSSKQ